MEKYVHEVAAGDALCDDGTHVLAHSLPTDDLLYVVRDATGRKVERVNKTVAKEGVLVMEGRFMPGDRIILIG